LFGIKGTEGLFFSLLPRPAPSHLTDPDPVAVFNLLPEPLVTDRLAVVRRLTYQMNIPVIQMCPEAFTPGKATRIITCTQRYI
jgi:hypothetical protein